MSEVLWEYRCPCGALLMRAAIRDGVVEIKCRKCDLINRIDRSLVPALR